MPALVKMRSTNCTTCAVTGYNTAELNFIYYLVIIRSKIAGGGHRLRVVLPNVCSCFLVQPPVPTFLFFFLFLCVLNVEVIGLI